MLVQSQRNIPTAQRTGQGICEEKNLKGVVFFFFFNSGKLLC